MNAARIRIGRVRLKAGGAEVRLMQRPPTPRIIAAMRDWVDKVQEESRFDGEPPSAFMAIAFWPGGDEPWRLPYQIGWDTIEAALPLPLLTELGPAQLKTEGLARMCEGRIMNHLGYEETPGDDPDDAA